MKTIGLMKIFLPVVIMSMLSFSANAGTTVAFSSTNVAGSAFENVYVPCIGEWVHFTGAIDAAKALTVFEDGSKSVRTTFTPKDVTGVSPSGINYRAAGSTVLTRSFYPDGSPSDLQIENSTFFIGRGAANDLKDYSHVNIGIDEQGNWTFYQFDGGQTCGVGG